MTYLNLTDLSGLTRAFRRYIGSWGLGKCRRSCVQYSGHDMCRRASGCLPYIIFLLFLLFEKQIWNESGSSLECSFEILPVNHNSSFFISFFIHVGIHISLGAKLTHSRQKRGALYHNTRVALDRSSSPCSNSSSSSSSNNGCIIVKQTKVPY